jgi:putative phosphoribosyl transferase
MILSLILFEDRSDAGQKLAEALQAYKGKDAVVYGIPRGGVIVANEIARSLEAPLDLVITRKIGHPLYPEYAIAAVGEGGQLSTNPRETEYVDKEWFEEEVRIQQEEAQRRRQLYMQDRKAFNAANKIAIIVDDGLATGLSMFAAIEDVRRRGPSRIIVAVPVAPTETVRKLSLVANEVVALYTPEDFRAIGGFYKRFDQVTDAEVVQALSVPQSGGLPAPNAQSES